MGRPKGKVQLKLIENPKQRNQTYQSRMEGLKKIAQDLAVLCNISVLVICVNPKTGKVESWPNNDQEARDIIVRYQSLSSTMRDKNKLDLSSVLECQIRKFQPDLKHAQEVKLQQLDSKMKLFHDRIRLLKNDNKAIVPRGSSEQECTTFWQDLMQDAIGFDYPYDPAATFSTQSEYNYGALPDQEARDIIVRYQSLGSSMRDKNKLDLSSVLECQSRKFQPDLKHAQKVKLQQLDSKMKLFHDRIQLLENNKKAIVPRGSSEQECTTFWQDLMQDAIGFDDPYVPAATFSTQSEDKYEALADFELDTVPLNPPENSAEAGVFSSDLWMRNGDGGTDYSNCVGYGDFGQSYRHHQADFLMNGPMISCVDTWEISEEKPWLFGTKP